MLLPRGDPVLRQGILLGTGGLRLRAYTRSAKDALDAAGIAQVRQWAQTVVECPIPPAGAGQAGDCRRPGRSGGGFGWRPRPRLPALLPVEHWPAYAARITELTAGKIAAEKLGETFQAAPVEAR